MHSDNPTLHMHISSDQRGRTRPGFLWPSRLALSWPLLNVTEAAPPTVDRHQRHMDHAFLFCRVV